MTTRITSSVTSLSWIPSEAISGSTRLPFDLGVTHEDDPPPDVIEDLEALHRANRREARPGSTRRGGPRTRRP